MRVGRHIERGYRLLLDACTAERARPALCQHRGSFSSRTSHCDNLIYPGDATHLLCVRNAGLAIEQRSSPVRWQVPLPRAQKMLEMNESETCVMFISGARN